MSAIRDISRLPEAHELGTHVGFVLLDAAIGTEVIGCIQTAHGRNTEDAKRYMLYGAARRLRVIQRSYSLLYEVIKNNRKNPLKGLEQVDLDLHLNSLYLHLRGVLDNLAWAIAYELELYTQEALQKNPTIIGLFNSSYIRMLGSRCPALGQLLSERKEWHDGLKGIRDPAAHRIPSYVAPSVLKPEEALKYRELEKKASELIQKGDFAGVESVHNEIDNLGVFEPLFINEIGTAYPMQLQIDLDIENIITIIRDVRQEFESHDQCNR